MNFRIFYRFIPIILGLIAFGYLYIYKYVYLNNKHFTDNKIDAKIIRIYNYENKSLQFFYSKKYCITTTDTDNDTLKIGDSIKKEANSSKFEVYRKINGEYIFYKSYEKK